VETLLPSPAKIAASLKKEGRRSVKRTEIDGNDRYGDLFQK
jgi:hypothetical protein